MTRPGESVEGIEVPLGDPDALAAAGKQLAAVSAQLDASASRIAAMPSLLDSWAGPGSSAFASFTVDEAASVRAASLSVLRAGISIQVGAGQLEDAQRRARRAIARAERARERIDAAKEAIREAVQEQGDARGRMEMAAAARAAAEIRLIASAVDALAGDGAAALAVQAADAEYRAAEQDLREAERREARARDRLDEAMDDLKEARRDGREAADDAEIAGLGLQSALAVVPAGASGLPGVPARGHLAAAAGIPRPEQRPVPIGEQEPPEHWPGFAKTLFKIGRGEATVIAGTLGLAKSAYENPEKIPGAVKDVGVQAYEDPIGTGKAVVGYDVLASGKWEDWVGQMGIGFLAGGGTATAVSRVSRLPRVIGPPSIRQLGPNQPAWGPAFAGRRLDFAKPDLNMRANSGSRVTVPPSREALAREFPNGVRYTRAGYPVFTPYATKVVYVDGLTGDMTHDNKLANLAAKLPGADPPDGYTWHHAEDGRRMELVPRHLHRAVQHTGGRAAMPDEVNLVTPGGAFTPLERTFGGLGGAGGATAVGPAAAEGP